MRNPQHIWTSTTLKLIEEQELVDVMLSSNGVAKIIFEGVGGIAVHMHGEYGGDPREVIAAYKIMMDEIDTGLARAEKCKRLSCLASFQKELNSQLEEVSVGNEPISDDDIPDLGRQIGCWREIEDLGEVENNVVYLSRSRREG